MSDDPKPCSPESQALTVPSTINGLLASDEDLNLTEPEAREFEAYQMGLRILGPAGGSVMVCPGNQDSFDEQDKCPYASKCPLLRMHKAPENKLCPIERAYIEERFSAWCEEIKRDPMHLKESERVTIADLTWIDLQANRCVHVLSRGEEARLTVTNPKDVHPETFLPVSWEKVIHPNVERLDQLVNQRRMILKEWMLSPEQQWKRDKAENKGQGKALASAQSARADKLKTLSGQTPS